MAHVTKMTRAACGHMFKHYERAKDEKGNYIKFGNESIDTKMSYLNYNLAPSRQISQGDFVRQRCSEVRMQNRKDVNVMCSWIITAPKNLLKIEEKNFFKESYKFLSDRYGADNIISAYVHMDEVTPHMHFAFVPVVKDKKRDGYKVSAKEAVNRRDLQTFHKDLSEHLKNALGHEVSILNEATKDGNKSIEELKRISATERLGAIISTHDEVKASMDMVKHIVPQNTIVGNIKGVSVGQIEILKEMAVSNLEREELIINLNEQIKKLEMDNRTLTTEAFHIRDSIPKLEMENYKLRGELNTLQGEIDDIKEEFVFITEALKSILPSKLYRTVYETIKEMRGKIQEVQPYTQPNANIEDDELER